MGQIRHFKLCTNGHNQSHHKEGKERVVFFFKKNPESDFSSFKGAMSNDPAKLAYFTGFCTYKTFFFHLLPPLSFLPTSLTSDNRPRVFQIRFLIKLKRNVLISTSVFPFLNFFSVLHLVLVCISFFIDVPFSSRQISPIRWCCWCMAC